MSVDALLDTTCLSEKRVAKILKNWLPSRAQRHPNDFLKTFDSCKWARSAMWSLKGAN
jgi:hypothetical protein